MMSDPRLGEFVASPRMLNTQSVRHVAARSDQHRHGAFTQSGAARSMPYIQCVSTCHVAARSGHATFLQSDVTRSMPNTQHASTIHVAARPISTITHSRPTQTSPPAIRRRTALSFSTPSPASGSPMPFSMLMNDVKSLSDEETQIASPVSSPFNEILFSRSHRSADQRPDTTRELIGDRTVRFTTVWGHQRLFVKVCAGEFWTKAFPNFLSSTNLLGGERLPKSTADVFRKAAEVVLPGHMHVRNVQHTVVCTCLMCGMK